MSGCLQARLEGFLILLLTIFLVTIREARGCVPMQGGITPSVTPSVRTTTMPVSTTTLSTTTTTTPFLECATCLPMDIEFEPADPTTGFINFDPPRGELSFNSSGCAQLLLTCRASPVDDSAYMLVNGNFIGMGTRTISMLISCDADGAWKSSISASPITSLACGFR